MERINIRVESRLKQRLELEAKAKGISPSVLVRRLLEEHLQEPRPPETCFQIAQRLGIIGSIKGLPADLSTNPGYMEGFGRD